MSKPSEHHEEQPKNQCKGYWIPIELSNLGLSKIEQLLLSIIDSLDSPAPNYCFAGNRSLAESMDMSESRVSHYITKFKRMGLIKEMTFDGRRRRMTCLKENWYKRDFEKELKDSKKELCVKASRQTTRKQVGRLRENTHHITKTIPKPNLSYRKAMTTDDEEAMPFLKEKLGFGERQKFPLKKDQIEIFKQMAEILTETPQEKLIAIIRRYHKDESGIRLLKAAISHLKHEIQKGTQFKKPRLAMFNSILSGKISPISENVQGNKAYAKEFSEEIGWTSIEIKEKYILCQASRKEISLDQEFQEFQEQFYNLYKLSRSYQ
jgi:DNA-binding transcriptional ArsR family regulator